MDLSHMGRTGLLRRMSRCWMKERSLRLSTWVLSSRKITASARGM